eukprot:7345355-Pyramimonas_sp.AAC.1
MGQPMQGPRARAPPAESAPRQRRTAPYRRAQWLDECHGVGRAGPAQDSAPTSVPCVQRGPGPEKGQQPHAMAEGCWGREGAPRSPQPNRRRNLPECPLPQGRAGRRGTLARRGTWRRPSYVEQQGWLLAAGRPDA